MSKEETLILNHKQIEQKINRIAYQVFEDHYNEKTIIMAGIANNGYRFAELLKQKIEAISTIKVDLHKLSIDKKSPLDSEVQLALNTADLTNEVVIVVDDVLKSGKTLMYGIRPFLDAALKQLSVAVLVNRSHNRFPVNAKYVGMSLATTLKEHIEVSFEKENEYCVYLH